MVEAARRLSAQLQLTGTQVFFLEGWVPYAERANFLLEADVGISLHQRTLETRFAFRTRVLDYLWASLVPVVNDGDTIADLVRTNDVGRVVPMGDDAALGATLAEMMDYPEKRRTLAARCGALAQSYTWETVAEPILAFCRQPRKPAMDIRTISVALQQEMQRTRRVAYETSQYAQELEKHIERSNRYIQDLEVRAADPSFRTCVSARMRKTPLRHLLEWKQGRSQNTSRSTT
jgi:hypothetical protein